MSLESLTAIGSFTVGSSAAYPIIHITERHVRSSADGLTGEHYLTSTYTIKSAAWAQSDDEDDPDAIRTLADTLRDTLARRGEQAVITERGVSTTLAAGAAANGALAGYPRCEVQLTDEFTFGPYQGFTITIETIRPLPAAAVNGYNLVEHEWEQTTEEDIEGTATVRRSGSVRVANGQNAEAYVQTQIIGPARETSQNAGRRFQSRITITPDAAAATYEYTDAERGPNVSGSSGVTAAEVIDRTSARREGRVSRTVSGWATGTAATDFAEDQEPTPGALELLIGREISEPAEPDGRVDFSYEILLGTTDAMYPGIAIYAHNERIEAVSGGREAEIATFAGGTPKIWLGPTAPYIYTQHTRIEFTGPSWPTITPRFNAANRVHEQRIRRSANADGLLVIEATETFAYTTAQALPDAYQVDPPL